MNLVVIESPFGGTVRQQARNLRYLRAAMADCFKRGEAPYASHALYTQPGVLCDAIPGEREMGIKAGFAWGAAAKLTAVYIDLGISRGMRLGISEASYRGRFIEFRTLPDWQKKGSRP